MNEGRKQSLLGCLPERQREEARTRIDWMVANGWDSIGLWTYDEPADIGDLVGVPRDGPFKGRVQFAPQSGRAVGKPSQEAKP